MTDTDLRALVQATSTLPALDAALDDLLTQARNTMKVASALTALGTSATEALQLQLLLAQLTMQASTLLYGGCLAQLPPHLSLTPTQAQQLQDECTRHFTERLNHA